jgi:hypothetical protein
MPVKMLAPGQNPTSTEAQFASRDFPACDAFAPGRQIAQIGRTDLIEPRCREIPACAWVAVRERPAIRPMKEIRLTVVVRALDAVQYAPVTVVLADPSPECSLPIPKRFHKAPPGLHRLHHVTPQPRRFTIAPAAVDCKRMVGGNPARPVSRPLASVNLPTLLINSTGDLQSRFNVVLIRASQNAEEGFNTRLQFIEQPFDLSCNLLTGEDALGNRCLHLCLVL